MRLWASSFRAAQTISKLMEHSKISKSVGCLYGQLIGDSLGCRYEFLRASNVREMIEADRSKKDGFLPILGGGAFHLTPGQITDDSEMAFSLAASMCRCGALDAEDVACSYVRWALSSPPDIGNATFNALSVPYSLRPNMAEPVDAPTKKGIYAAVLANVQKFNVSSQSNGCLMRISPLAVAASNLDPSRVREIVKRDCSLTHCDEVCLDAVGAFVFAVSSLINGTSNTEAYEAAVKASETDTVQDILKCAKEKAVPVKVRGEFTEGDGKAMGYIGIALQSAFHELLHAKSFYNGVVDAVSRGGDTDTNGAIVAAMLGARFGVEEIPERWLATVRSALPRCPQLGMSFNVEEIVPRLLDLKWAPGE